MKIAITGGTGFVGRNVARALSAEGQEVMLLARGRDRTDPSIHQLKRARFIAAALDDERDLVAAFEGCEAVVHCAGINRELGHQTYQRVHVEGTRHVVEAARRAGTRKVVLISFLRARPNCGSRYHESKWAAEEIVRSSGLDHTIFKCGVIYGRGDHMLDHLSHAFYTFPMFAFVGFKDKPIRPNAVEDVVRLVKAAVVEGALSRRTVAVVGPEELTLRGAVRRVARVVGRKPLMFPMPLWFHYLLGRMVERVMIVPLVSTAQVRMLAEGLAEPGTVCDSMPEALAPKIRFTEEQIRKGLPKPGPFGWRDVRCCGRGGEVSNDGPVRRVFFEMP
jgi:NADH dehydrogenase